MELKHGKRVQIISGKELTQSITKSSSIAAESVVRAASESNSESEVDVVSPQLFGPIPEVEGCSTDPAWFSISETAGDDGGSMDETGTV